MQGAIEEEAPQPSLMEHITKLYNERKPFNELVDFQNMSIPPTLSNAMDKMKLNTNKSAFYYMAFFFMVDILFILFKRLIIIPIAITAAFIVAAMEPLKIKNYKVEPMHAATACMGLHVIICLLFRRMAGYYIYFIGLNGFCAILVLLHASILNPEDKNEVENSV